MKHYCRAYPLAELRRFPAWSQEDALPGDTVVYLWNDLTVVTNPVVPEQGVLWESVTDDWARFCRVNLKFEILEGLSDE
ncbi:hypothetical protein ACQPYK_21150 [Streptosporangium sp. CA-135522]|uniref:hypothetical protein n=1 Tax=Streptosporangium sp. CA-135522 TaxID=3240072 RepID=UPI003D9095F4